MQPNTSSADTLSDIDSAAKRVAIQGYAGAFHEIAARYYFEEQSLDIVPAHTFEDLVDMTEAGEDTDLGIMAIENTIAGSLIGNYKLLNKARLKITGEVFLRIQQNLLTLPGVRIEDLTEVHSHPIAIEQCRVFFRQYPHIRLIEAADTALSARHLSETRSATTGAIASALAAQMYGLQILAPSIETNKKNHTRFLVVEREAEARIHPHADKVSICFATDHAPGSLYKVLAVLAAYNVNLTKIQSTPIIGKPWEYLFFVDFVTEGEVGHQQAIDAIRPLTRHLNVLGVYERGRHFEL